MDQLVELTSKEWGCLHKVDHDNRLMGTFTDGLLRQVEKLSSNSVLDKCATDEVKGKSFYGTEDVGADKRHIYKVPKDELAAVLQVTEPSKNKDTSIRIYKLKDLRCYAQVLMAIKVPQACTAKACASRGSGMGSTSSGGETRNLGVSNIEISESEWDSRVIQSELPVMVMFTADWCGTCRIMSPILDKLESDYTDRFTF
ncbi:hypothetical protein Bca4012_083346 [Brassica carinata]